MQREEKLLETALEVTLQRINDLKSSIRTLLAKLEYEHSTLSWPSVLDSFALISGQVVFIHSSFVYFNLISHMIFFSSIDEYITESYEE